MRKGQRRLLAPHQRRQLRRAIKQPGHFHERIFSIMPSDVDVRKLFPIGELANLERVANGQHDPMPARAQFLDDRFEEHHVRRVVEVDPERRFHREGWFPRNQVRRKTTNGHE